MFEYHHAVGNCQQHVAGATVAVFARMKSVVVAFLLLAARTVNAQSPAPPPAFTPEYGGGIVAGGGTPIGTYGVEGMYAPLPWLVVSGGIGANDDGRQAAISVRARSQGTMAFYGGVGEAGGHYEQWWDDDFDPPVLVADGRAAWTTFELGLEMDSEHLDFRIFAGMKLLDNASGVCHSNAPPEAHCGDGGYAGLALDVH